MWLTEALVPQNPSSEISCTRCGKVSLGAGPIIGNFRGTLPDRDDESSSR
ncbi:MAG: hypothetical protein ACHQE5_01545 [Actinomycetes bacterium]